MPLTGLEPVRILLQGILVLTAENMRLRNQVGSASTMTMTNNESDEEFCSYMNRWIDIHRLKIRRTTFAGYKAHIKRYINPFFSERKILLSNLTARDLEEFYQYQIDNGLSPNSVHRIHATIRASLNYAVKHDLISRNVALSAELPVKTKFAGTTLTFDEIKDLIRLSYFSAIYPAVLLAGVFGLRRSEVIGMRWSKIDFQKSTITIDAVYSKFYDTEKETYIGIFENQTKNNSSTRTIIIPERVRQELIRLKHQQENNKLTNRDYDMTYDGYVCVTDNGKLLDPNYVTKAFKQLSTDYGKPCRFHDLRHSVATYLYSEFGYDIKDIQVFLGHSNISTTGDIYMHISDNRKRGMAEAVNEKLKDF